MASHDLHHGDHAVIVYTRVLIDLHAGGRDIFRGASKAGAVISSVKVVVNSLGNAHYAALVPDRLHIAADLVAGVHGIVAAVIEEITHIVFFEYLKNALIVRVVSLRIRYFIAAGAELRGRGMEQKPELFGILFIHHVELIVKNALDTVRSTVDLGDLLGLQSRADNAVSTCVDDCSGTSGLPEYTCTNQFF